MFTSSKKLTNLLLITLILPITITPHAFLNTGQGRRGLVGIAPTPSPKDFVVLLEASVMVKVIDVVVNVGYAHLDTLFVALRFGQACLGWDGAAAAQVTGTTGSGGAEDGEAERTLCVDHGFDVFLSCVKRSREVIALPNTKAAVYE